MKPSSKHIIPLAMAAVLLAPDCLQAEDSETLKVTGWYIGDAAAGWNFPYGPPPPSDIVPTGIINMIFVFGEVESVYTSTDKSVEIWSDGELYVEKPFMLSGLGIEENYIYTCFGYNDEYPPLCLPKGKTYHVVVPEGAASSRGRKSERFETDFTVPEYLDRPEFHIRYSPIEDNPYINYHPAENGCFITEAANLAIDMTAQCELMPEAEASLYEDGVLLGTRRLTNMTIQEYPDDPPGPTLVIAFDPEAEDGPGGRSMRFGKGHSYEVVVPEGAVHAWLREDIPNAEIRFSFTGGSDVADDLSHVRSVVSEQEPQSVRYFNMQGIEVREPSAPGIYVRHDGTKTGKLINRP